MDTLIAKGPLSELWKTDRLDSFCFEVFTFENMLTPLEAWVRVGSDRSVSIGFEDTLANDCSLDQYSGIAMFGTLEQIDAARDKIIQWVIDNSLDKHGIETDTYDSENEIVNLVMKLKCDDTGVYCLAFLGYYENTMDKEAAFVAEMGLDYLEYGAMMDDTNIFHCLFDGGFDDHISDDMRERLSIFSSLGGEDEGEEAFQVEALLRFTEGTSDKIYGIAYTGDGDIAFWGKTEGHLSFKEVDKDKWTLLESKRKKGYQTYFPTPTIVKSIRERLETE